MHDPRECVCVCVCTRARVSVCMCVRRRLSVCARTCACASACACACACACECVGVRVWVCGCAGVGVCGCARVGVCVCVFVWQPPVKRLFKAGGPWTLGWHGPTKTHPSCRASPDSKAVSVFLQVKSSKLYWLLTQHFAWLRRLKATWIHVKCVIAGRFPKATSWHGSRCDPRESRHWIVILQTDSISANAHFLPSFSRLILGLAFLSCFHVCSW